MMRQCPSCGAAERSIVASIDAGTIVRANSTYRPDALSLLGLVASDAFQFAECSRCGVVYAAEVPTDEFLSRVYREAIDAEAAALVSRSPGWIAHQLGIASGLVSRVEKSLVRLLDFGCGDGSVVAALASESVVCVGFDPHLQTRAVPARPELVLTRTLEEVEVHAPFDAILLSDVIEHVPEPRQVLATCHDLLASGGWICVSIPDFGKRRLRALLRNAVQRPSAELNPWEHLNYFTPQELAALLETSGFDVAVEPYPLFGFRPAERGIRRLANAARSLARMLRFAIGPAQNSPTVYAQKRA